MAEVQSNLNLQTERAAGSTPSVATKPRGVLRGREDRPCVSCVSGTPKRKC
jgi:hypothetical protein